MSLSFVFLLYLSPHRLQKDDQPEFESPSGEEIINFGVRLGKVNKPHISSFLKEQLRTSLVVQWLRI